MAPDQQTEWQRFQGTQAFDCGGVVPPFELDDVRGSNQGVQRIAIRGDYDFAAATPDLIEKLGLDRSFQADDLVLHVAGRALGLQDET